MNNYKFFYVRASAFNDSGLWVHGSGQVCLAIRPVKGSTSRFKVAASYKSPADSVNFELGMRIADGRLRCRRVGRNFEVQATSLEKAFEKAKETLLTAKKRVQRRGKLVRRPIAPDWLFEAVVNKERKLVEIKSR